MILLRDILGLEPAGCDTNARYFRSDGRDHTLVYLKGHPHDHATAFRGRYTSRGR